MGLLQSQRFGDHPKLEAAAVSDSAHIQLGAFGEHVGKVQQALIDLDSAQIDPGELQIMRYGPSTANAVLNYKRKRNIINRSYQTQADNIVGKMTIAALDREMVEYEQNDLELEIDGPYLLYQEKAPPPMQLFQFELASFTPVAQVRPRAPHRRPRPRPRPGPPPATILPITATPAMPLISFRANVHGAAPAVVAGTAFDWVITITEITNCPHRLTSRPIITTTHRQTRSGDNLFPAFPATFPIRGGSLTASVTATLNGRQLSAETFSNVRIHGTNPPLADVFAALPHDTLKRICRQESGGRQFNAAPNGGVAVCPLWSSDNAGGVGLFQITNPQPTDDEVWNWRSNVAGGIRIFNGKLGIARGYPAQVRRSTHFRDLVNAFNRDRRAHHQPNLTITLPDFTTGDFDANLQQLELDTIRGFNGFGGRDVFGLPLHEFRVALDGSGGLRIQNIDEHALTGEAIWERVPVADRPQRFGDPNYVANVLAQSPNP